MLSRPTLALLTTVVTLLTGCSYFQYPDVHKLTIRQGNIINQELIDQLRPGLTRSQVRYILGTPLLADSFHQSRWDYYFSIKRPGREELRERIAVYFSDDKLTHFSGDYLPSSVAAAMTGDTNPIKDSKVITAIESDEIIAKEPLPEPPQLEQPPDPNR